MILYREYTTQAGIYNPSLIHERRGRALNPYRLDINYLLLTLPRSYVTHLGHPMYQDSLFSEFLGGSSLLCLMMVEGDGGGDPKAPQTPCLV